MSNPTPSAAAVLIAELRADVAFYRSDEALFTHPQRDKMANKLEKCADALEASQADAAACRATMQIAADQLKRGEWNSHTSGTWAMLNDALTVTNHSTISQMLEDNISMRKTIEVHECALRMMNAQLAQAQRDSELGKRLVAAWVREYAVTMADHQETGNPSGISPTVGLVVDSQNFAAIASALHRASANPEMQKFYDEEIKKWNL